MIKTLAKNKQKARYIIRMYLAEELAQHDKRLVEQ